MPSRETSKVIFNAPLFRSLSVLMLPVLTLFVLVLFSAQSASGYIPGSYIRRRPVWHGHTARRPTSVKIRSIPSKVAVYYAGRLLGYTPLTIKANSDSTPYDIVLKRQGYMRLRSRIFRNTSRTYTFKLSPVAM